MTVAVSCNLSDGVILGVDSAVSLPTAGGVAKVYENAEKLFQLGSRAIGVATFGLGAFEARSVGSYLREFEILNPKAVITGMTSVEQVVEELRSFFVDIYTKTIIPLLEKETGKRYEEIPVENRPVLGLVVGGFSHSAYLSEVWEILIPVNDKPNSASRKRSQGEFGTNWFAMYEPIRRYIKGHDGNLVQELLAYLVGLRGAALSQTEEQKVREIVAKFEYQIPYFAMPMGEGVDHTRFLVELVINHHRYALGAPVVGGAVRIGKVTYKGERFQILT